jgi:phenylacetic acid degradation operon negative regulatory protein
MVHRLRSHTELRLADLVALMAPFGISEAAVRQAVSRMARQGWLISQRRNGRAWYRVTERGRRRIEELSPRIYGTVVEWDGRWRLLTYTVHESRREQRDRLRKELSALGWAPLSSSTWITPADTLEAARQAARACEIARDVHLFTAAYAGPHSDRELLERCWDVAAIASAYREFIAEYRPRLQREREARGLVGQAAFVQRLRLVHDYRKFTYLDPGLPSELLPAHWPGTSAAALFREYYAALEAQSTRYFHRMCAGDGG